MRDTISIARVQLLHPAIRQEVTDLITKIEASWLPTMQIRIVQGLRTFDEQNALYAQGRTKPGTVVTHAKAGQSYHNFGLAIDFAIMYDKDNNGTFETLSWDLNYDFDKDGVKDWQEVVRPFVNAGYEWGGSWPHGLTDNPHLQKIFGLNWRELLRRYNAKDFIADTNYVNLK